jgi:hypothetical protein
MLDCLIIGAGISGLLAARKLSGAGQQVVVLDKGRGVGGRMATRRIDEAVFDHGAQFFTSRDERFGALVEAWVQAGLVREWTRGFPNGAGDWKPDSHPRYIGAQGMTSVPKHLAQRWDVRTGQKVTHINRESGAWLTVTETGETYTSQALLLTAPVPQSLALLDAGNYRLPAANRAALEAISYHPCIAVMAVLDAKPDVPEPGGVQLGAEPISWLAENQRKGISPVYGLTIHGAPGFSREHFDGDRDAAGQLLLQAAAAYIGSAGIVRYQVHGWRYSQPVDTHDDACLAAADESGLLFAGDAFAGPRVEGAALSGLSAADVLLHPA